MANFNQAIGSKSFVCLNDLNFTEEKKLLHSSHIRLIRRPMNKKVWNSSELRGHNEEPILPLQKNVPRAGSRRMHEFLILQQ
jgi:hypothetical protein